MINTSRRSVLFTTGSVLILSSCALFTPGIDENRGINREHGDDPTGDIPAGLEFKPTRIAVVVLGIGDTVRHQYARYNINQQFSYMQGKELAEKIMSSYMNPTNNKTFPSTVNVTSMIGNIRTIPNDLSSFGFSGQFSIYIYIIGNNLEFGDIGTGAPYNSIRFTEFSYKLETRSKNDTFYEAKLDSITSSIPGIQNNFQYVSNVYRSPGAGKIYSMNILTLMDSWTATAPLPIIIDPDTGNGGGRDP